MNFLNNKNPLIIIAAVKALGEMKIKNALPVFKNLLTTKDNTIKQAVESSIKKIEQI